MVIPVHFAGQPCDMRAIHDLSIKYKFKIIEDASHAIGGKYYEETIGNCNYGDITIFSFHPVKIITTGEGGMCLTNDTSLAEKMSFFREHGITRRKEHMEPRNDEEIWNYQQVELGYNFRMTDLEAALGISQMNRLDEFVLKRNKIAERYDQLLKNSKIIIPWKNSNVYSSYHLYVIRLKINTKYI